VTSDKDINAIEINVPDAVNIMRFFKIKYLKNILKKNRE